MWNDFLLAVQNPHDLASVNRGPCILAEYFCNHVAFCVHFLLGTTHFTVKRMFA